MWEIRGSRLRQGCVPIVDDFVDDEHDVVEVFEERALVDLAVQEEAGRLVERVQGGLQDERVLLHVTHDAEEGTHVDPVDGQHIVEHHSVGWPRVRSGRSGATERETEKAREAGCR